MMIRILLTAIFILFFSLPTYAQLFCTNESANPVWLAVAYSQIKKTNSLDTSPEEVWLSEGWIYLKVGQTAQLTTHIGFDRIEGNKTNFYYYAYQPVEGGKEWRGNRKFLVDVDPEEVDPFLFKTKILYANMPEKYRHRKSVQFKPFKMATNITQGFYTIVLKQDDRNEPPIVIE